ncbi:glycosyltransferase family 4 protein [Rhizobium laguerreae]|uniref:glycosyltransferase family 4 protein n=1 Tax=Rhizobium laguerreae TaxID=1076926 RepID=UPI001C91D151|nr:glycosyltransferase family 4 protein [Rhizobium laguerreae]MBY3363423.1 glycosyltransferase family 4 protein [Rhizobium laguerreae]
MKIFCGYETTDAPWGGANTFLRALYGELAETHGMELVFSMEKNVDLVFLNQTSRGPGSGSQQIEQQFVDDLLGKSSSLPVVVRAVNLRRHSAKRGGLAWWFSADRLRDRKTLSILANANYVIFQSDYQREIFLQNNFRPRRSRVIRNGADQRFVDIGYTTHNDLHPLRIFASAFSTRKTKRHDLLAQLSELDDVELTFAGHWREGVPPARVKQLGTLSHAEMVEHMKAAHFFAHPAIMDPCPNSMIEALAGGVPVLYGDGPGSGAELASHFGLPLDESDLSKTIGQARSRYQVLCDRLSLERSYFSVKRAAEEYAVLFREVAGKRT